jgi:hypothetical protein
VRNTDIEEFAAELVKSDPSVSKAIDYERKVGHLRDDQGFQFLKRRILEQRDRFLLGIAKGLLAGRKADPEEIARMRGFYEGALYVIERPEKAAESLEQLARKAILEASREEEEGEYAPFQ